MQAKMLENKVAIVSGASYGMGFSMAELFAREGAKVVMTARGQEKLDAAVKQIREKTAQTMDFEKLTRAAVQSFIDTVYVYDAEKIEIKFLFDDVIDRVASYIEQHTEKITVAG